MTYGLMTAGLMAAGLMAGGPAEAAAQEVPRVYIVSVPMEPGLEAEAARAGSAARSALRSIEGVDWRGPDQRFLGYDDSAIGILDRARTQLDEGRQAYLQLDLDAAIERLRAAIDNFDAAAAAMEDPSDLGQALLVLGASHAFNGQTREAATVFQRLHTQMPHIQPDPDTFPPEVVQLYDRARPRDARRPTGVISIDSSPQGAVIYVDFLARGLTPLNVDDLIAGDHVVRVTRPGSTPFVETMTVQSRRASTSNAYLVDAPNLEGLHEAIEQIPGAAVDEIDEANPIHQVATMLELDKIGVIRVSGGGGEEVALELLLYDVASGRRLVRGQGTAATAVGQFEASVQSAVAGAFEAALRPTQHGDAEQIPAVATTETTGPVDTGPSTPIVEEWWFWTIIGAVVVAGVAVGIGVAVASEGPPLGNDPGGQVVFRF